MNNLISLKYNYIYLFLLISIVNVSVLAEDKNNDIIKGEKIHIEVDGLSCPFCAYGLEKKLKALDSIDTLDININEGLIKIFLKKDKQISKTEIREKVAEAGFTFRKLVVDGKEYEIKNNSGDK
ncbi:MAG: copper chaperone [Calditrichaeota bacterium]|nr:MAG: copper chaperone [Calditrichota bacterium]MBL1207210.1 copper chaperone [Calditrichota bacterium]NOG47043.1 heavy-metal-associated domain-containing protein [Calditrichota bacterium]